MLQQNLELSLKIVLSIVLDGSVVELFVEVWRIDLRTLLTKVGEATDGGIPGAAMSGKGSSDWTISRHFNNKYYYSLDDNSSY